MKRGDVPIAGQDLGEGQTLSFPVAEYLGPSGNLNAAISRHLVIELLFTEPVNWLRAATMHHNFSVV